MEREQAQQNLRVVAQAQLNSINQQIQALMQQREVLVESLKATEAPTEALKKRAAKRVLKG